MQVSSPTSEKKEDDRPIQHGKNTISVCGDFAKTKRPSGYDINNLNLTIKWAILDYFLSVFYGHPHSALTSTRLREKCVSKSPVRPLT